MYKATISEMLKGCDAYIATGSNNSARYFEQYFENTLISSGEIKLAAILIRNESIAAL